MSLTLRAYLLVTGVVLLGIAGQWLGAPWQGLWRWPGAVLVLGLVLEWRRVRQDRVTLDRHLDGTLYLGCPVSGEWRLHNPGRSTLYLQSQARYPAGLRGETTVGDWRVAPGQTATQPFRVTPVQLGDLDPGPVWLRRRGLLGLAWWPWRQDESRTHRVLPATLRHGEYAPGQAPGANRPRPQPAVSGQELLYLRDYQVGDPLHALDWKATARAGRPTVRVHSREQRLELLLAVDAGRASRLQAGELTRLHHAVNVAARLAELAVAAGDQVGLVVFADRPLDWLAPQGGLKALRGVRERLAGLESHPRESNPLNAVLWMRRLLRHRGLVVWLTEVGEREAGRQLVQSVGLLTPKHSPLIASPADPELEALRRRPARDWLDPYLSHAAADRQRSIQATVLELRRLGAQVIHAPPQRLDPLVLACYRQARERRRV